MPPHAPRARALRVQGKGTLIDWKPTCPRLTAFIEALWPVLECAPGPIKLTSAATTKAHILAAVGDAHHAKSIMANGRAAATDLLDAAWREILTPERLAGHGCVVCLIPP